MNDIVLQVKGVNKDFGGMRALCRVDLDIRRGEIVGLIGPNGAGKTTLINICSGFIKPNSGEAIFKDKVGNVYDLTRLSPHKIANLGVRRTFQRGTVYTQLTVLQNIVVSLYSHYKRNILGEFFATKGTKEVEYLRQKRAEEMLQATVLFPFKNTICSELPIGYQRILSAYAAVCSDPTLLLLDEPSTGLTAEEARGLSDLLTRLNHEKGISMLVISHEMEFVMGLIERAVVLDFGEKIAEGSPEVVRNDSRVIEAYLGGAAGAVS